MCEGCASASLATCSPDLIPCVAFMWGFVKDHAYVLTTSNDTGRFAPASQQPLLRLTVTDDTQGLDRRLTIDLICIVLRGCS
ncbi:hypothetical protein ANN_26904 [Periplaneta americana]|uniref:Uncharacterized protein n=1 Tax=Periplaneta americana TaxID=6978 RepID=A0ABQ8RWU4_PERAM|nr:hypothetical protein ANN_26904 [Periplaneta americana]